MRSFKSAYFALTNVNQFPTATEYMRRLKKQRFMFIVDEIALICITLNLFSDAISKERHKFNFSNS